MMHGIPLVAVVSLCVIMFLILRRFFRLGAAKTVVDSLPGPSQASFWMGNINRFYNRTAYSFHRDVAINYGPVVNIKGMLGRPLLYVSDPKALHSIVIKDQYIYEESRSLIQAQLMTLGPGLLSTLGDHHRKQRKLLNPVFSVGHMRHMLPIFYRVTYQLRDVISSELKDGAREIDALSWLGRMALELIGQGGLGYSFDPLTEDTPNTFGDAIKSYMPALMAVNSFRLMTPYVVKLGSAAFRRRVLDVIPHKPLQKLKDIVDTMGHGAAEVFHVKKQAMEAGDDAVLQQVGEGKDIMSILMKANMEVSDEDKLPEHELIAQMTTLVFAAMDTTSSMLCRILQCLVENPEAEDKLRQEIVGACGGHDLSYDQLMELRYLDAVVRESLRLYPPINILPREARKDMVLPLSEPIRGLDGKMIHEIPIPKDTDLVIGVLGSNLNKAIWGVDALEWKPERWLSPLPSAVTEARIPGVYSNLMTFMGGAKACIGFKFSELEMIVLCTLLSSFTFDLPKEPISWNVAGVNYPTTGDSTDPRMLLKVSLREGSA
ncbi:cytochrome P450 monooxygenase [Amylocystis lapponica]|nr:cytochrome P450 monooxygenase [Amylocystis lapponica]